MARYGIVLAAGEGTRLAPAVAPYHKPLLVVNGRSMVRAAVDQFAGEDFDGVIVVVSPQNAQQIISVCDGVEGVLFVVQPKPIGPGQALLLALRALQPDDAFVLLMGDNIFEPREAIRFMHTWEDIDAGGVLAGTRVIESSESASRFTRIRPFQAIGRKAVEGPMDEQEASRDDHVVWCGPLVAKKGAWMSACIEVGKTQPDIAYTMLGPIMNGFSFLATQPSTATDIGIPEMLP